MRNEILMRVSIYTLLLLLLFSATNNKTSVNPNPCKELVKQNDSLRQVLKAQNFKINRVKYYLKICYKNPKQDKFLKGWVNRAVN